MTTPNPSADKRSVSTDALETLGMIHFREEKRDAIHLAVIPVTAGESLSPSAKVRIKDGRGYAASLPGAPYLGIVDPFLPSAVQPGQSFWLVIPPRVIKSLRHVWSHESVPDEVNGYTAPLEDTPEAPELPADGFIEGGAGMSARFDAAWASLARPAVSNQMAAYSAGARAAFDPEAYVNHSPWSTQATPQVPSIPAHIGVPQARVYTDATGVTWFADGTPVGVIGASELNMWSIRDQMDVVTLVQESATYQRARAILDIADIAWSIDNLTYRRLMDYTDYWLRYGDYAVEGGRFESAYLPDSFWPLYELVTGMTVEESNRTSFFSCSC